MSTFGRFRLWISFESSPVSVNCIFKMINCSRDFVTGAMEQWGLITYRETSLLFDSVNGATSSKQSKTSTISHEYVHQWFGNLMTCNWWDNIWIQEGPATYYKVSYSFINNKNVKFEVFKIEILNSLVDGWSL